MALENLGIIALQSGILFLLLWLLFRFIPALPANARAWIWRIAFLKPIISLIPFAAVTLYVLPTQVRPEPTVASQSSIVQIQSTSTSSPAAPTAQVEIPRPVAAHVNPLLAIYLLGAVGVAGWGLLGSWKATRNVRLASPVTDEFTLQAASDLFARAHITRRVRIVQSDDIQSAMLVGGIRSSIVLPASVITNDATSDIRLMLAHEVAHIARRDLFWFGLTWLVQSLFFFNPLVWLAARRSRLDHESATDQYASKLAAVPTQTYAEMLLRTSVVVRNTSLVPGTLPMGESFRMIHRRLEAMKHFDTKPYRWRKSAIGAIALVTIGLLPLYQWAEASSELDSAKHSVKPPRKKHRKATPSQGAKASLPLSPAAQPPKPTQIQKHLSDLPPVSNSAGSPPVSIVTMPAGGALAPVSQGKMPPATTRITVPMAKSGALPPTAGAPNARGRSVDPPKPKANSVDLPPSSSDPYAATGIGIKGGTAPVANSVGIPPTSIPDNVKGAGTPPTVTTGIIGEDPLIGGTHPTISFKFEYQDSRAAIEALLRHEHKTFVIESSVIGRATVTVENVTFETALNALMKATNSSFRIEGNTYYVFAVDKS